VPCESAGACLSVPSDQIAVEEERASCARDCSVGVHDASRDSYDTVISVIQDMFQIQSRFCKI
jgi:hypothetical protein